MRGQHACCWWTPTLLYHLSRTRNKERGTLLMALGIPVAHLLNQSKPLICTNSPWLHYFIMIHLSKSQPMVNGKTLSSTICTHTVKLSHNTPLDAICRLWNVLKHHFHHRNLNQHNDFAWLYDIEIMQTFGNLGSMGEFTLLNLWFKRR